MDSREVRQLIEHYFHRGFQNQVIVDFLNNRHAVTMSLSTLQRRLRDYGLSRPDVDVGFFVYGVLFYLRFLIFICIFGFFICVFFFSFAFSIFFICFHLHFLSFICGFFFVCVWAFWATVRKPYNKHLIYKASCFFGPYCELRILVFSIDQLWLARQKTRSVIYSTDRKLG